MQQIDWQNLNSERATILPVAVFILVRANAFSSRQAAGCLTSKLAAKGRQAQRWCFCIVHNRDLD